MCRDSIKIYLSSIENISVTLQGIVWGSVFHTSMRVQLKGTRQQQHSHTHTQLHSCCTNIAAEIVWEIKKASAEETL